MTLGASPINSQSAPTRWRSSTFSRFRRAASTARWTISTRWSASQTEQQEHIHVEQQEHQRGIGRDRKIVGHGREGGDAGADRGDQKDDRQLALQAHPAGPANIALKQAAPRRLGPLGGRWPLYDGLVQVLLL